MESNHLSVKGQSVKSSILHKIENAVKNKVWIQGSEGYETVNWIAANDLEASADFFGA